jgi:alpha-galactosidase/6-phospho-beta-glucosidase family protein
MVFWMFLVQLRIVSQQQSQQQQQQSQQQPQRSVLPKVQEDSFSVLTADELHPVWTREELLQQKEDESARIAGRATGTESRIARHTEQKESSQLPSAARTTTTGMGHES